MHTTFAASGRDSCLHFFPVCLYRIDDAHIREWVSSLIRSSWNCSSIFPHVGLPRQHLPKRTTTKQANTVANIPVSGKGPLLDPKKWYFPLCLRSLKRSGQTQTATDFWPLTSTILVQSIKLPRSAVARAKSFGCRRLLGALRADFKRLENVKRRKSLSWKLCTRTTGISSWLFAEEKGR